MTIPHHGPQHLLAMAPGADSRRRAIASAIDAYRAAQSAVIWLAEAEGAQFRGRLSGPGAPGAGRCAEPADVRAARIPPETAARICRDRAERARGDGITWPQIGEALGLHQGPDAKLGYDLGVAAFEHFTGEPDLWYRASFQFRCASCGEYITDRGPFESHPEDNEQGHAPGCGRLAADVAAWRAQWDAWEAEGWAAEGWPVA
jgi:hypothetical protein